MYFSASHNPTTHCVGVATANNIRGPYTPEKSALACPVNEGGAIDASGVVDDDGTRYVVYKIDGNSLNVNGSVHPTPIRLQKMQSDAITPDGGPITLIDRDDGDGPVVEAPSISKQGDTYFLSFSSNKYDTTAYDTSYATASNINGPYTKASSPDAPLVKSGLRSVGFASGIGGPGGSDFTEDGTKILFHAFQNGKNLDDGRSVWAATLKYDGEKITIA